MALHSVIGDGSAESVDSPGKSAPIIFLCIGFTRVLPANFLCVGVVCVIITPAIFVRRIGLVFV